MPRTLPDATGWTKTFIHTSVKNPQRATDHIVIEPYTHRQLFLDDRAIERMEGVEHVLHQPRKEGPVLRADVERGANDVQSRNPPQWNPEKQLWEWFYWSYWEVPPHGPYARTDWFVNCYATSTDLVHWERPSLGLFEWHGSRDNNICHDPEGQTLYHVFRDEAEPDPARRYKGMFDWDGRHMAVSPNGFAWTHLNVPPVRSEDESHFFFDETTGRYTLLHKLQTEWGRSVWLSRSEDWEHWTPSELILQTDEIDRANRRERIAALVADPRYLQPPIVDDGDYIAQVYNMAVLPYEGLYVGFPLILDPAGAIPPPHDNFTGLNQTELAVSHDLRAWQRVADRAIFLGVEPWDGVSFDTAQVLPVGRPLVHDDEILIFHNGLRYRGYEELYQAAGHDYTSEEIGALSLARLRRDGFVSLDAAGAGSILTRPFACRGGNLHVNADASRGRVAAELVDADTLEPLAAHAISLRTDSLNAVLVEGAPATAIARLRLTLEDASLFSFWMELK